MVWCGVMWCVVWLGVVWCGVMWLLLFRAESKPWLSDPELVEIGYVAPDFENLEDPALSAKNNEARKVLYRLAKSNSTAHHSIVHRSTAQHSTSQHSIA